MNSNAQLRKETQYESFYQAKDDVSDKVWQQVGDQIRNEVNWQTRVWLSFSVKEKLNE